MSERDRLHERLRAAGLDDEEIRRADEEGRLPTLAVDLALGARGEHTLTDVAKASRLSTPYLRDLLRAMGRASPVRGERVFTEEDIAVAQGVRALLDAGIPRRELLEVSRVVGQTMAQVADTVRRAAGDALLRPGDSPHEAGLRFATAADELGPLAPAFFGYAFRLHLREGVRRQLLTEAEREAGRLAGVEHVAIGFADLVGYTRLGGRMPAEDVGRIATRLAELASAAAHPPVRLVKTIGDAAMFASPDTEALVRTVGELRDAVIAEGEDFPSIRCGVSCGPATGRAGDWFGATVNLAARVADVAKPGQVLVTEGVCAEAEGLTFRRRRKRSLRGVDSRIRLFSLEAPEPQG